MMTDRYVVLYEPKKKGVPIAIEILLMIRGDDLQEIVTRADEKLKNLVNLKEWECRGLRPVYAKKERM